jgi:hypothetical protein
MLTNSWTEKYKPEKLEDIVGNKNEIDEIIKWINDFDANKKTAKIKVNNKKINLKIDLKIDENLVNESDNDCDNESDSPREQPTKSKSRIVNNPQRSCLLVTGNHGIGKTCMIYAIANNLDLNIFSIDLKNLNQSKNIKQLIENILQNNDICSIMLEKKKKRKIILIDEIETFFSNIDKNIIQALLKYNQLTWKCPIILISNNQHSKINNYIKTLAYEIKILNPASDQMFELLVKIAHNEHIKFQGENCAHLLINHAQNDYRQLIFTLQDLASIHNDEIITYNDVNEYISFSQKKDIDTDIYKITSKLFSNYPGIDESITIYETEKTLIPLMIQQNYINYLDNSNDLLNDIADSISMGDIVENYIYGDQNWDLKDIHGFYACALPAYYINKRTKNKFKKYKLDYPLDYNRTSIKRINNRNIKNANKYFNNMNIYDYLYLNNLLKILIENNAIDEYIKLMRKYNITSEGIESVIKIDKIQRTKVNIPNTLKKIFL